MKDFIYIINTNQYDEQTKNIIKNLEEIGAILTFDIADRNKRKRDKRKTYLENYIISKYRYIKESDRIYIRGDYDMIFRDIMSFCSENNVGNFLVYSKNIKNNLSDVDKNNSAFIKICV